MKCSTKIVMQEHEFRELIADWYSMNGEDAIAEIISSSHIKSCRLWSDFASLSFGESISPIFEFTAKIDNDILSEAVQIYCVKQGCIKATDKIRVIRGQKTKTLFLKVLK